MEQPVLCSGKARANPDSSVPVAHGLHMNLEHGSSTTMLAPVAIQVTKGSSAAVGTLPALSSLFLSLSHLTSGENRGQ